jgi:hypothetical protein
LEAVWQGRHRITSLFRRWKPWHMEIKGDTIFYHRTSSSGLGSHLASDSTWYTLDLTWLTDVYITDSSRIHNNELVMRFVQDDSTLHLRLPKGITTPTLEDWLGAFRKVQGIQQRRRRLGTNLSEGESTPHSETMSQQTTGTWPGEDIKPQPRQRGSSLTVNVRPEATMTTQMPMKTETASTPTTRTETMTAQVPLKTETTQAPSRTETFQVPLKTETAQVTSNQPMQSNVQQVPLTGKSNVVSVGINKPHELGSATETSSTIDPAMQQRQVIQS